MEAIVHELPSAAQVAETELRRTPSVAERDRLLEGARRRAATIRRRVVERTSGQIRDLAVLVDEDNVVLSGHANSFYAKQLAQHAAMQLTGGLALVNDIEVA